MVENIFVCCKKTKQNIFNLNVCCVSDGKMSKKEPGSKSGKETKQATREKCSECHLIPLDNVSVGC